MNTFAQKPHIVYFQQNPAMGAVEEYIYLLMEGINKRQFNVSFICPDADVLTPLVSRVQKLGISVYRYSLGPKHARIIWRLREIFLKLKADIIHFNDPCLDGIIAARLAGVPLLLMTHHTPELNRQYNWKGRLMERIAFRHCGLYFIFSSEYDRETGITKDGIAPNKSSVIYYGLPPERFSQKYDKEEIYKEFHIDDGYRIIANIARLNPQKGQKYFIEAASLVMRRYKEIKFFFIGEGELRDELMVQVKEKGLNDYFVFTGHRSDIPRLLSAIDILVMPSLFEGLCFAVIEASAMGVPIIATDVGGMRRSVSDGRTGILVPPRDPNALAEAIIWILEHPQEAKEMGLEGRKYFYELFTQERMVKKTEEFYETIRNHTSS